MEGDTLAFAQVMIIIVLSVASFVGIGFGSWLLWRLVARSRRDLPAGADARLRGLETAVEAIAIEVERISEAQRFTVTLLSERLPLRTDRAGELLGGSGPKRVNTPH